MNNLSLRYLRNFISSISKLVKRPFSAVEIVPLSSETTTTIASDSSVMPRAARCLVPISGKIIWLSVNGKIQPAASINVFCNITAPSCNGDSGLNIDNSKYINLSNLLAELDYVDETIPKLELERKDPACIIYTSGTQGNHFKNSLKKSSLAHINQKATNFRLK